MNIEDLTIGSYLSGMGMLEAGALEAGFAPVFGVEFDPGNPAVSLAIADMHEHNIPGEYLLRRDVCDVDPAGLDRVDWFHASPVCKEFSQAKKDGKETAADVAVANAIVRYILHHKPRFVTLENVWAYRLSQSWNTIYQAIKHLYDIRVMKINTADYGVPQTRVRMIVLAQLGGPVPPKMRPTHTERPPEQASLLDMSLSRWIGWHKAIADIIPTLPDSKFAPWQLQHLPNEPKTYIAPAVNGDGTVKEREALQPVHAIQATAYKQMPRAYLSGQASDGNGRVVKMTPRALARFQSLPDWYILSGNNMVDCTAIGNGIPSLFAQRLGEHIKRRICK